MRADQARAAATDWVATRVAGRRGVLGAFYTGSIIELGDDEPLPDTSDVDLVLVVAGTEEPPKLGKIRHGGVLLEVTLLPQSVFADAESVAGTYYLAPSFRSDQVVWDPTGLLRRLLGRIRPVFDEPAEVRRRRDDVLSRMTDRLGEPDEQLPWSAQVSAWLFPASLPAVAVLVAARQNPTVRLRYLRARTVLTAHRQQRAYEQLLELLGCAAVSAETVQRHLDRLAVDFDLAARVASTPFFFSGDITPAARAVALTGSQRLVEHGDHREAVFWLVATAARCLQVLRADAPELVARSEVDFDAAATELLQLTTPADLRRRVQRTRELVPDVRALTETLILGAAGPGTR